MAEQQKDTLGKDNVLRQEFSVKLSALVAQEIEELRRHDKQQIKALEAELAQLKKAIQSRDNEIATLKKRHRKEGVSLSSSPIKKPRLIPSSSNVVKSVYDMNSERMVESVRKSKSMYEDRHIMPTQYSDDEDSIVNSQDLKQGRREIYLRSSPTRSITLSRKASGISSQSSIVISPKKKSIHVDALSPVKMGRKLTEIRLVRLSPNVSPVKSTQYSSSPIHRHVQEDPVQQQVPHRHRYLPKQHQPSIKGRDELEEEEIEDSEEEMSIIDSGCTQEFPDSPIIGIPKNVTTILQKRQFLLKYYTDRLSSSNDFKINLIKNPINQISWDFGDFKQNPNYRPDKNNTFIRNNKIINQRQFDKYKQFYQAAANNDANDNGNNNGDDADDDQFEDKLSQIFDKFATPPGFMQSDFPDTQEQEKRKEIVRQRQLRRLARRIKSCVSLKNGIQVGEFIFACDILNQYVVKGRWYIR